MSATHPSEPAPSTLAVEADSAVDSPDEHGKFSLNEDWLATITGLGLLALCLLQVIPNIKGWF